MAKRRNTKSKQNRKPQPKRRQIQNAARSLQLSDSEAELYELLPGFMEAIDPNHSMTTPTRQRGGAPRVQLPRGRPQARTQRRPRPRQGRVQRLNGNTSRCQPGINVPTLVNSGQPDESPFTQTTSTINIPDFLAGGDGIHVDELNQLNLEFHNAIEEVACEGIETNGETETASETSADRDDISVIAELIINSHSNPQIFLYSLVRNLQTDHSIDDPESQERTDGDS